MGAARCAKRLLDTICQIAGGWQVVLGGASVRAGIAAFERASQRAGAGFLQLPGQNAAAGDREFDWQSGPGNGWDCCRGGVRLADYPGNDSGDSRTRRVVFGPKHPESR